jgi:hypothetical protein
MGTELRLPDNDRPLDIYSGGYGHCDHHRCHHKFPGNKGGHCQPGDQPTLGVSLGYYHLS